MQRLTFGPLESFYLVKIIIHIFASNLSLNKIPSYIITMACAVVNKFIFNYLEILYGFAPYHSSTIEELHLRVLDDTPITVQYIKLLNDMYKHDA